MSTKVRQIDALGDWTFGASLNNYVSGQAYVAQMIRTNLLMFLGNCFFDAGSGIDWFTYLGGTKDDAVLLLAVQTTIINSPYVTGIDQTSVVVDPITRSISISYQVQSLYSVTQGEFVYSLGGSVA